METTGRTHRWGPEFRWLDLRCWWKRLAGLTDGTESIRIHSTDFTGEAGGNNWLDLPMGPGALELIWPTLQRLVETTGWTYQWGRVRSNSADPGWSCQSRSACPGWLWVAEKRWALLLCSLDCWLGKNLEHTHHTQTSYNAGHSIKHAGGRYTHPPHIHPCTLCVFQIKWHCTLQQSLHGVHWTWADMAAVSQDTSHVTTKQHCMYITSVYSKTSHKYPFFTWCAANTTG